MHVDDIPVKPNVSTAPGITFPNMDLVVILSHKYNFMVSCA